MGIPDATTTTQSGGPVGRGSAGRNAVSLTFDPLSRSRPHSTGTGRLVRDIAFSWGRCQATLADGSLERLTGLPHEPNVALGIGPRVMCRAANPGYGTHRELANFKCVCWRLAGSRMGLGVIRTMSKKKSPVRRPTPTAATPITRVVIFFMENHTTDNFASDIPGVKGNPALSLAPDMAAHHPPPHPPHCRH